MKRKYKPKKLFLKHSYDYSMWSDKGQSSDKGELSDKEESEDLSDRSPLEGDEEEVKEGKGLKILTPNKLLTTRFLYKSNSIFGFNHGGCLASFLTFRPFLTLDL